MHVKLALSSSSKIDSQASSLASVSAWPREDCVYKHSGRVLEKTTPRKKITSSVALVLLARLMLCFALQCRFHISF